MKEMNMAEVLRLVFRSYPPDGYLRVGDEYFLVWNIFNSGVWVAAPRDMSRLFRLDAAELANVREVDSWWQDPETGRMEPLMGWEE